MVLDRFSTCNSTVKYNGRKQPIRLLQSHKQQGEVADSCDVFSGRWVFDNTSYPLYNESDCPYMSDQLACHKHGRPDFDYQYWRWQPHACNLNRSNVFNLHFMNQLDIQPLGITLISLYICISSRINQFLVIGCPQISICGLNGLI